MSPAEAAALDRLLKQRRAIAHLENIVVDLFVLAKTTAADADLRLAGEIFDSVRGAAAQGVELLRLRFADAADLPKPRITNTPTNGNLSDA